MSFEVIQKETKHQRQKRIEEAKKLLLEEYGTLTPHNTMSLESAKLLNQLSRTIETIEKDLTETKKLIERIKELV
jgi:hypothetical protein